METNSTKERKNRKQELFNSSMLRVFSTPVREALYRLSYEQLTELSDELGRLIPMSPRNDRDHKIVGGSDSDHS